MKRSYPRRTDGKEKLYRRAGATAWLFTLIAVAMLLCLLFLVWLRPVRVSGDSMSPALEDGESVLVDQLAKYWKQPARGDMVFFEDEQGAFIKRIVALPGETVDIQEGRVYINSRPLDESAYAGGFTGDMQPLTVPDGCVFVLGDNRALVYDSRLESVGCIPYTEIEGVLRVRVSPFSRFTLFF